MKLDHINPNCRKRRRGQYFPKKNTLGTGIYSRITTQAWQLSGTAVDSMSY